MKKFFNLAKTVLILLVDYLKLVNCWFLDIWPKDKDWSWTAFIINCAVIFGGWAEKDLS